MELKHLKGLDEDLNKGIKYNRKHGGVSDELKRRMKRPESPNWRLKAFINHSDEEFNGESWNWVKIKKKQNV